MDKRLKAPLESNGVPSKSIARKQRRIGIIRRERVDEQDEFRIHVVNVDLSSRDRRYGCRDCDGCLKFVSSDECAVLLQKPSDIDRSIDVDPAVRLRLVPRPTRSRLCVLNSKVYVFDGYIEFIFEESDLGFNAKEKWISTYELKEENLGGLNTKELGESDLTKICEMNYPKYRPRAVPTPNGKKILVFSTFISPGLDASFELYDTDSLECRLLPPIPQVYTHYEEHHPAAYSFVSDTKFFLETHAYTRSYEVSQNVIYIFDLEMWEWELLGSTGIPWQSKNGGFEVMEGGYVLNFDMVHYLPGMFSKQLRGVLEKWDEVPTNKRSTFPLSFKPWGLRLLGEDILLVDFNREDKVCHVCTLRAYPLDDKTHDKAQVFIDLIRIYLPTADIPALESTLVQSLRVVIKRRVGKDAFDDIGCDFSLCCL